MGSNVEALEETLASLEELGRFETVDAARKQALRSMAHELDENPGNAQLWKQYRELLKELTADDGSGSVDEALAGLFGAVRDTPPA